MDRYKEKPRTETEAGAGDINLLDCLATVYKYKKFISFFTLGATIIAVIVALILPPVYRATVTLLPPQNAQSSAATLVSQLGGAGGLMASAAGIKSPNDMYIGMLKSRTIADGLIKRFKLMEAYETPSLESARIQLAANTMIEAGKDNLISISVLHNKKDAVANIANAYVNELMVLTTNLAVTEASQRRLFYSQQLQTAKDKLAGAEIQLKSAIEAGGVISVDNDSRAVLETVSRLRAQISAKEIQLNSMRAFVTPQNTDFRFAEQELASLRSELNRLENGRGEKADSPNQAQGLENIKVLRDVKYYQALYEQLAKQHEMARLDEAREGAVIQVLDAAIEPEGRFKPKRTIIVGITAVASLFLAILIVLFKDAFLRFKTSGTK